MVFFRTPGKCKSIKTQIPEEPTIKTRVRSLLYFGTYVNIETPKIQFSILKDLLELRLNDALNSIFLE